MKIIRQHIIFWICYFLLAYFSDLVFDPETTLVKEIIFFTTQNVFLFYAMLFFLNKYDARNKTSFFLSLGRLLLVVVSFFAIRFFVRYYFLTQFFNKHYSDLSKFEWSIGCLVWLINYFFFALGYYYFQTSIKKQKLLLKTQKEKLNGENEKIRLENVALRAQINPHFLYNTLDFLYAKALHKDAELSDGIMRLSEIMRYSLKPQDPQGLIPLVQEIEHLENIIGINRLRFHHALHISFQAEGDPAQYRIIPLVLITLAENVLKHGQLNDPENPAHIYLSISGGHLLFTTANKKRTGPKEMSTGIGLDNTHKRLSAVYGQQYTFDIRDDEHHFYARLHLPLIQ